MSANERHRTKLNTKAAEGLADAVCETVYRFFEANHPRLNRAVKKRVVLTALGWVADLTDEQWGHDVR